ncbi:tyrosine-type recombinase/integrase [Lysinibacillus sp. GbtcB16]|uniref:tyrosine-type recombinase/integrase n=1 Tax=Lysinibacillus sp. GbtcB16 TaxID=2824761 RepID=UPI001C304E4A|nr:tyrosine-type recombinase/integrase [Lysinibacillus sp. GbtcB16]
MLVRFSVQDFIDERKLMNTSEYTLRNYKSFFKGFEEWLRMNDITDISNVSANTLRLYLRYCQDELGNSATTINNKVKNLKAFFNHLYENEFIDTNPTLKLKKQITETRIEVFNDQQIRLMLRYLRRMKRQDHKFTAYRNLTVILTLLGTGIRLNELRNLKWSDVTKSYITVIGKGRKQETVPLTKRAYENLIDWRTYQTSYFEMDTEYVFTHRDATQISYEATKGIFKKLSEVMQFKDVRLSAHTFRHTFAHRFLMSGGDVFTLQKILRHSSLHMTEKYLALWGHDLNERNEKYNPLNHMDI